MIYLGIDPGKSGAAVAVGDDGKKEVCRFDKCTEKEMVEFFQELNWGTPDGVFCMIEKLHPMPNFKGPEGTGMRGSISSFKIGMSYGFLRGCLVSVGIPFEEIAAQKWQRAMDCLSKGDKKITRQKAQQLFPNEKVIHQTADAMLIAEYCRRVISKRG